jgi:hypothetical protein
MPFECSPLPCAGKPRAEAAGATNLHRDGETWNRSASLAECDQTLFEAISEIGFDEPMMLCLTL